MTGDGAAPGQRPAPRAWFCDGPPASLGPQTQPQRRQGEGNLEGAGLLTLIRFPSSDQLSMDKIDRSVCPEIKSKLCLMSKREPEECGPGVRVQGCPGTAAGPSDAPCPPVRGVLMSQSELSKLS